MTDRLDKLSKQLEKLKEGFQAMKDFGIDEDLLIAYVMLKTKLSRRAVTMMVHATDEFYQKLLNKAVVDNLIKESK